MCVVAEHQIPEPAAVEHAARADCPCGPVLTVGPRPDGTSGQLVVHRDWTDLISDQPEE